MKKLYLLDIIEKYHLGGLVERVKVQINNKTLSVKFIATNKNLIGTLSAPEISIEDCEFGIYDTTQLIKLVSIMGQDIEVKVEQKDKVANKLFLADTEYNLEYVLANTMLIPNVPNADEPQYDLEANIDREFVDKFAKAKKALDTEVFTVMSSLDSFENTVISFNLGEINGHNNKISFHIPAIKASMIVNPVKFPLVEFNEILLANKNLKSGNLQISEQGLLKVTFKNEENIDITYLLVGRE
jgi:hypothetical protein